MVHNYYLADGFIDEAPLNITAPPNGFKLRIPETRRSVEEILT